MEAAISIQMLKDVQAIEYILMEDAYLHRMD